MPKSSRQSKHQAVYLNLNLKNTFQNPEFRHNRNGTRGCALGAYWHQRVPSSLLIRFLNISGLLAWTTVLSSVFHSLAVFMKKEFSYWADVASKISRHLSLFFIKLSIGDFE